MADKPQLIAPCAPGSRKPIAAFTLVELLVVIAIIAILASLLLPVFGKAKLKTQGLQCMNSHRQLALAWMLYTDDNNGQLLYASELPYLPETLKHAWVTGTLDFDPNKRTNWDPDLTIKKSPMWPYCGNSTEIWKCPADRSYVVVDGEQKKRVRSMSMNIYLGGWAYTDGGWGATFSDYKIYQKASQLSDPGPANVFVFMDMREDSIDMGNFATKMAGWKSNNPKLYGFFDLPGFQHHRAGGFSFADGHSEIRPWKDSRTMPPLVANGQVPDHFNSPDNQDVAWLQQHSTRPAK